MPASAKALKYALFAFVALSIGAGVYKAAALTALWTGVLTSVSPCPLATNITALTYISKHSGSNRLAVPVCGLLYALGRALTYILIGFLLVKSLLSAPSFSFFMQKYGNQLLSPVLVLAGMYMLGMFGRGFAGFALFDLSRYKAGKGAVPALFMGFAFALAFCPISAALYFGVVIPLAAKNSAPFSLPLLYGLGTALTVLVLAVILDLGFRQMPVVSGLAGKFNKNAEPATAWVFIAAGIYLGLKYIFGIL